MDRNVSRLLVLIAIITLLSSMCFIKGSLAITYCKEVPDCSFSGFLAFLEELFGDVTTAEGCRYGAKDNLGHELDTLKIIENPRGGYLGVYHCSPTGNSRDFNVNLAISTDILNWKFNRTIEQEASQPTVAQAPNRAYIVAFEKHVFIGTKEERHLGFYYFPNLTSLLTNSSAYKFIAPLTVAVKLEGTPNIYNITMENSVMKVRVGFHYNDASGLDKVAIGHLSIPLDNPQNMIWNCTKPQQNYNQELLETYPDIKGHIGDRDYGQIFGRNFTLQEAQYVRGDDSTWAIFVYDHLTNTFHKLNIKTYKGSTSFGNPTFTVLNSPAGDVRIIVTYFLHTAGNAAMPGEGGELIFTKKLQATVMDEKYDLAIYSNSNIQHYCVDVAEKSVNIVVTGEDGTKGYCIIKLPNNLTRSLWNDNFTVFLDGAEYPFEKWSGSQYTYIYLDYLHSEHEIKIIPEPFYIITLALLPGLLILTLFKLSERKW